MNVSFSVDTNKLACQTCLLWVTLVDPLYDMFFIVLHSGRPVYNPNLLRPNPNPQKPVSSLCHVHGLGRTLTPLNKNMKYGHDHLW